MSPARFRVRVRPGSNAFVLCLSRFLPGSDAIPDGLGMRLLSIYYVIIVIIGAYENIKAIVTCNVLFMKTLWIMTLKFSYEYRREEK